MPAQLRLSIEPVALAVAFEEMSFPDVFGYLVALAECLAQGDDVHKAALASHLLQALKEAPVGD